MSRVRSRRDAARDADLLRREGDYVRWLMNTRGLTMKEAIAYAQGGQASLDKLRQREAPRATTRRDRDAARIADMPKDVRRWQRVDAPCPRKGCLYPANHSGPHRVPPDLKTMLENSIAALDAREEK